MVIVAAVDRSDRAPVVVREAASLSRAFDEPLHVVHVLNRNEFVELERTSVEESGAGISPERIREMASDVAANAASVVDEPLECIGLIGNAEEEIVRYADERGARYVVIGPRKRSPTGKVLFGSVAQDVILNADCPVVTTVIRDEE